MWMEASAKIIKGSMKCKVKNRVRVGLSTENPPHSQETNIPPM